MAQTNYTPISLYYSSTTTNVPTAGNLVAGELAINTADGKLFYKDSSNVVQVLATKGGVGTSSNTQVLYNSSGLVVGSAGLTYDGTNLTTTGTATATRFIPSGSTAATNGMYLPTTDTLGFSTNSGERVRIDGTGLTGIGTTTSTRRLQVGSGAGDQKTAIGQSLICLAANSGNLGYVNEVGFGGNGSTNVQCAIGSIVTSATSAGYADLYFATRSVTTDTAPTERMRITSAGLVGIGTSSPAVTLHASASVTNSGGTGTEILRVANTRANTGTSGAAISFVTNEIESTNQYIRGQITGEYDGSSNVNGRLLFATANTSGTLVERIRITSAGNVGIGTSSPGYPLQVMGTIYANNSTNVAYLMQGSQYGGSFANTSTANTYSLGYTTDGSTHTSVLYWNASGNVGIGTSSPNYRLQLNSGASSSTYLQITHADAGTGASDGLQIGLATGSSPDAYIAQKENAPLIFQTNATERMRIDSSGSLLVGTTSASGAYRVHIANTPAGTAGVKHLATTTGTSYAAEFYTSDGNSRGYISYTTTGTIYSITSDYRLKENQQTMTNALQKIALLKPKTWTWKQGYSNGQGQGFIAHELQEIFPDAVVGEKDAIDADGKPKYQGVDTSYLIATLTKAIQEQQTLIESLTTRLTALENK